MYQNKVNLSLTFTQRLGHQDHNCKMGYFKALSQQRNFFKKESQQWELKRGLAEGFTVIFTTTRPSKSKFSWKEYTFHQTSRHFTNKSETGANKLSQRLLGLIRASPVTIPETIAGHISATVPFLKWRMPMSHAYPLWNLGLPRQKGVVRVATDGARFCLV